MSAPTVGGSASSAAASYYLAAQRNQQVQGYATGGHVAIDPGMPADDGSVPAVSGNDADRGYRGYVNSQRAQTRFDRDHGSDSSGQPAFPQGGDGDGRYDSGHRGPGMHHHHGNVPPGGGVGGIGGSGSSGEAEVEQAATMLLARLDTNGDDSISRSELVDGLRQLLGGGRDRTGAVGGSAPATGGAEVPAGVDTGTEVGSADVTSLPDPTIAYGDPAAAYAATAGSRGSTVRAAAGNEILDANAALGNGVSLDTEAAMAAADTAPQGRTRVAA